jgi:radical SAM protein with 4Fe4S-binding SPASM domain
MARDVIGAGIGSISISLDATPEINDALRGPGVFAGVEAAVVNLQDAGFKGKLEIISTITTPALATLDTLRKKIAQMRVPLWRVSPVMPIGRAAERGDLVPDCHGVRGLLEYVRASRQDGLLPKPEFSEEGFLGWRFEGFVRPYLCRCHAGVSVGGIKCDGRIGACPELGDAFDQGHIGKDRFKDVWDTGYQAMRDRRWTRASGPCSECERWPICRGGALHLYPAPGKPFLRCLYLQCKEAEIPRT